MNKRLIRLDSSSLELWSCPEKFRLTNIEGLVPRVGVTALDFGQAIHRALALYRRDVALGEGLDLDRYIQTAVDYYRQCTCVKGPPRTVENLVQSLRDYVRTWGGSRIDPFTPCVNDKGEAAVELPFALPFASNDTRDIVLCGVIDSIGTMDGKRMIMDIKHTSNASVPAHQQSYTASVQFMLYSWVLRKMGWVDYYPPAVIDGVYISKQHDGARCIRSSPIDYPDYLIERTMGYVQYVADQLLTLPLDGQSWPRSFFGECKNRYGYTCQFYPLCMIPQEYLATPMATLFDKREYNPAKFGD